MTIAVLGATGYTGSLVVRELVARRLPIVAVGRNPAKLEALEGDFERRVADTEDYAALTAAISDCDVVVSTVGPFTDLGEPAVRAAIERGVHYLDTTGEQAFMHTVFKRYDTPAREAGVALVPAVGFDYVPGDMAAALACRALGRTPDRVDVAYLIRRAKASMGTKRTGMRVASMPCLVWRDGALREERIGSGEHAFGFAEGSFNVALWPGGEPLTVPRHTGARSVSTWMRMPKAAAAIARGSGLASPALRAGSKLLGDGTGGPSESERKRGHYEVVAVASAGSDEARCTVTGQDMYGMTAAACAEAAARMREPGFASVGGLAPTEAFEPQSFLDSLGDYLQLA